MSVTIEKAGPIFTVTLSRPEVRNAVDGPTGHALLEAFQRFDADATATVAVLYGAGGTFCAGADLKAVSTANRNRLDPNSTEGPMGPTRLVLSKPVIAAIEGHAVAGGLELACWADLRVASDDAVFGVFCRHWGVPLIDGGSTRLPRLIGHSRAMDMILTGRAVNASEALSFGLANRVVPKGTALAAAQSLAAELAAFPQLCMRADRRSAIEQWSLPMPEALLWEFERGRRVLDTEGLAGAAKFASGSGRHGRF